MLLFYLGQTIEQMNYVACRCTGEALSPGEAPGLYVDWLLDRDVGTAHGADHCRGTAATAHAQVPARKKDDRLALLHACHAKELVGFLG